jgi:hypothetical protein
MPHSTRLFAETKKEDLLAAVSFGRPVAKLAGAESISSLVYAF